MRKSGPTRTASTDSSSPWRRPMISLMPSMVILPARTICSQKIRTSATAGQEEFKKEISRGLLIGLDLLIAADIIRTVTLEPTLENVAALGLLVVVRTFLAWTLQLEAEGRWPWQSDPNGPDPEAALDR